MSPLYPRRLLHHPPLFVLVSSDCQRLRPILYQIEEVIVIIYVGLLESGPSLCDHLSLFSSDDGDLVVISRLFIYLSLNLSFLPQVSVVAHAGVQPPSLSNEAGCR